MEHGALVAALTEAADGPLLPVALLRLALLDLNGLHHLAHETVGDDHDGVHVLESVIPRLLDQIDSFLKIAGSEDHQMIVAVAAAAGRLAVVALSRQDAAQSGAAAHDVEHDCGIFVSRQVAEAFGHQRDSRARRRGHDLGAGRGRAKDHVDRSNFALALHIDAADFRQMRGHVLGHFILRRDGISEEVTAPTADRSLCKGFSALHKDFCHSEIPPSVIPSRGKLRLPRPGRSSRT